MVKDFTVKVDTRTRDGAVMNTHVYPFDEYTDWLSMKLKQMIRQVEDLCLQTENQAPREQWSKETEQRFTALRKSILDSANAVGRLPETLCYQGIPCNYITTGEMIARLIGE